jgi:hypothetical protein
MAVVQNTLIGSSRGKVGGTVFTKQFGKNVLKSKPLSVANPNTDKQKDQRVSLAKTVALYRSISSVINQTFKSQAVGMSAFNAFTSKAKLNAFTYTGNGQPVFKPGSLLISKGTISPVAATGKEITIPAKSVSIDFPTTLSDASQASTDKAVIGLYNATSNTLRASVTNAMRSAGTATATFDNVGAAGDDYYVYVAFIASDGSKSSDSVAYDDANIITV